MKASQCEMAGQHSIAVTNISELHKLFIVLNNHDAGFLTARSQFKCKIHASAESFSSPITVVLV